MNFYCRMDAAGSLQECFSQCQDCKPDAVALLKRIRQWDMLDSCEDGPFWKREIDAILRFEK